jgi:hypothetical protein
VTATSDPFTISFRVNINTLGSAQQKNIASWINKDFVGPEIHLV